MTDLGWVLVVGGVAAGTYALRVAPFISERLRRVGERHFRFLSHVSIAIAAGIVSRSVVYAGGEIGAALDIGIKVAAVVVALVFLRVTRMVPIALFAGVGVAVLLKSFER